MDSRRSRVESALEESWGVDSLGRNAGDQAPAAEETVEASEPPAATETEKSPETELGKREEDPANAPEVLDGEADSRILPGSRSTEE